MNEIWVVSDFARSKNGKNEGDGGATEASFPVSNRDRSRLPVFPLFLG
jgi:hypothetical protein